jgi:hypothetical protein
MKKSSNTVLDIGHKPASRDVAGTTPFVPVLWGIIHVLLYLFHQVLLRENALLWSRVFFLRETQDLC